jgi:hypothetical protein
LLAFFLNNFGCCSFRLNGAIKDSKLRSLLDRFSLDIGQRLNLFLDQVRASKPLQKDAKSFQVRLTFFSVLD